MVAELTDWFERVPKVELHLHLEGAIPYYALWELIQKYGGDPAVPSLEALQRKFAYKDFPHFIETWIWKNQFLREYQDFTYIAEAVARDLVQQHIWYAEVFYSSPDFARHGLETQKITEAIRAGLDRVPEVEVALVADLVRDFGAEKAAVTLAKVNEVKDLGVIGIGIGGSEQDFPPEPFAEVYERARQLGFHTSAHAGEAAGAASIWGAIRSLRVERIGHGTRAEEDESLLNYLAEQRIPLEVCPISNMRTGVVSSIKKHPVRRYFERGIVVTINTDDPKMFGNSLAEEYRLLEQELGFSRNEIRALILQGVRASWLSEEKKQRLIDAICEDPAWQEDAATEDSA
ncbi:MAG: adenosine deaminase [Anaerolineae bacterium]|jgi:adenosine deaminase|nr:adenosine deaminase [Anaerolineae bacterium]MDH7473459.1 adenosine deaminase [Anaerolineae bacterium]